MRQTDRETRERGSEGKGKEEGKEESEMGGPEDGKKRRGRRKKTFRDWEPEGGREEGRGLGEGEEDKGLYFQ